MHSSAVFPEKTAPFKLSNTPHELPIRPNRRHAPAAMPAYVAASPCGSAAEPLRL